MCRFHHARQRTAEDNSAQEVWLRLHTYLSSSTQHVFIVMALQRLSAHFLALFSKSQCYMGVFPMKYKNYFSLNTLGRVFLPSSSLVITHSQVNSQPGLGEYQMLSLRAALPPLSSHVLPKQRDVKTDPRTHKLLFLNILCTHFTQSLTGSAQKCSSVSLKFCFHVYCEDLEKFKGL